MAVFGGGPVLVAVALACAGLVVWLRSRSSSSKEMGDIPGTMGWPVVGETFSFISDFSSPAGILSFMRDRQRRFGKVFKTYVLGRVTVFMTGRDAAKILLSSGKDGVVSLNLFYTGKQVLGPTSLLTTNGDEHRKLRRLIGEPLSVDALKKYLGFINDLAVQTLDTWHGRSRVLVLEEASSFTLKVIANMLVSLEPEGEEQEKFRANFKVISSSFASLPLKVPGTAFHRGLKARNRMYAMLDSVIARRRSGSEGEAAAPSDFLQTLLRKHAGDEADKLTDAQLKDNILTLLVAGHDTTTAGLTWLVKFLGENPDVLDKLREEHLEIKESLNGSSRLRWSDVNNMPYTNKVMNETLRRATILPWYSRKAAQDFSIDGQWQRRPHRTGGQTATWTDAVESLTRRVRDQEGDVGEPGRGVHPPRPGRLRRPQPLRPQQIRRNTQAVQLPGVRERAADVPRNEPGKAGDLRLRPPPRLPIHVSSSHGWPGHYPPSHPSVSSS
eukprot:XP_023157142.1 abscisic acid 8'-hydroxylase 3 isoform X2 [Zea mays]